MDQWWRCRSLFIFGLVAAVINHCHAKNATKLTFNRRGKALNISKKPCSDPSGRKGTCTFKWDCINQNGTKIGTCMDGFIVGTCCYYESDSFLYTSVIDSVLGDDTFDESNKINYSPPYKKSEQSPFQRTTPAPLKAATKLTLTPHLSSSNNQLITWTSISPTQNSHLRPTVLSTFPFRQKINYPQFSGRWPFGVVLPIDQYRPKRPLQYKPIIFLNSNNNQPNLKPSSGSKENFTIFSGDNKNQSKPAHTVETTTLSVPIPEWTTTGYFLPPIVNSINRLPFATSIKPFILSNNFTTFKPTKAAITTMASTETSTLISSSVTQPQRKKPLLDYRKDCGVRALTPKARIVGGMSTHFGKWPWQILVKEAAWLGLYHKNKCGGVLISSKYAITAGHCQPGFLSSLIVLLGEYDLTADFEVLKPEMRRVKRMVVHRHYNPQNFDNDIALLELDPPVSFKPHVSPICLPEKGEDFTGKMAYVTGWGKTMHGGSIPNLLQEVQVPIVSNTKCIDMFRSAGHTKIIKDNFLCAGYESGGKDSCEGDSGGPLMAQRDDGRWVLVGTVSHGIRCADPNLPGVYMRISSYKTWIEKIVGTL